MYKCTYLKYLTCYSKSNCYQEKQVISIVMARWRVLWGFFVAKMEKTVLQNLVTMATAYYLTHRSIYQNVLRKSLRKVIRENFKK